jgi:DNA-binding transcriptional LysR family regulator
LPRGENPLDPDRLSFIAALRAVRRGTLKMRHGNKAATTALGEATGIAVTLGPKAGAPAIAFGGPDFAGLSLAALGASTALVGLAPERTPAPLVEPLGLAAFPVPVPLPAVELSMAWHARHDFEAAHRWFRCRVREALTS